MTRIRKYRAFDKKNKRMREVIEIYADWWVFIKKSWNCLARGDWKLWKELSELMDYAWLQDSKGKDVFEGDVVKWPHWVYEMIFTEWAFSFKWKMTTVCSHAFDPEEFEIIWNIHTTHKHLLENK